MWDENHTLVHKRVGERASDQLVPSLPQPHDDWRGIRITQVGAKFWPQVEKSWSMLNSEEGRSVWPKTQRVVLLQSGTWYLSLSRGRFCSIRKELCNLQKDKLTQVFVSEGRHAVRAIDTWARANPDTRMVAHLATVACARSSKPCGLFREGLASALLTYRGITNTRFQILNVAALADTQPGERVDGHPSLKLSVWVYSTWLSLICGSSSTEAAPSSAHACGVQHHVVFDKLCTAKGMKENCGKVCRKKGWSSYQHVPCQFQVKRDETDSSRSKRMIISSSDDYDNANAISAVLTNEMSAPYNSEKLSPRSTLAMDNMNFSHSKRKMISSSSGYNSTLLTDGTVGWRQFMLTIISAATVGFWLSTDIRLLYGRYVWTSVHVTAENKTSAESTRIDALGFARYIASMHVVLGHLSRRGQAPAWYISGWGFSWVPWFIMLSGYVLSMGELASTTQRAPVSAAAFVYARLRGIYPAYVVGLALSYVLTHGPLQDPGTLLAQALLLQAWVPEWVEHCLQLHTWFLSAIMPCWAAHGVLNTTIKTLSTRALAALLSACFAVGWAPAVIPRFFGLEADWYTAHSDKHLARHMTHLDVAVAFLKFHPLAFAHLYVCGVTLAHLRARLWIWQPVDGKTAQLHHAQPPLLVRRGACIGYAVLLAVFTVPVLRPPGHKLSARLGALAPAQALVLLGLSGSDDPLARLFGTPVLRKLGDVSFCGYILQFSAFKLYGSDYAYPGYWLFLLACAVLLDYAVVVPLRKEEAFRRFVGATFATGALMLLLYAGPQRFSSAPPHSPNPHAPAVLNWGEGVRDTRLELLVGGTRSTYGEFVINPSLAWLGPRLLVAAREHRVAVRSADGARVWNSSLLFGELHPDNLTLVAPMKVVPVTTLDRSPLSLAACAFSRNASAPDVLVVGAEDPRLVLSPSGSLLVTFNHLIRTKPDATCPTGDVVRRVFIASIDVAVNMLQPMLLVAPKSIVLSAQEKNWLVFNAVSGLYAVYSIEPHVVISITATGAAANPAASYTSSNARLVKLAAQQRAVLHGGANAIAAPETLMHEMALSATSRMVGAFHSLDARSGVYVNYVYLFDAKPPFTVTHISTPLPLTEAPPRPGAETPHGAHMAFLSGIASSRNGSGLIFTYGSSNVESRVLTMPSVALARLMHAAS